MPKIGMEPLRRADAINAALECICEYGIDRTTLDMVAAEAGFSKGIVAYYFKNKKQLILESMKAFLSSYQLKTQSSITKEMSPLQIVKTIIDNSLPAINDNNEEKINVSILTGIHKINLPQAKIARIFIQFIAKAATDNELKNIFKDVCSDDVNGISSLISYAKKIYKMEEIDEKKSAYGLLSLIYGLSFFRVADFMPSGENDNREIAFAFIDTLFDKQTK